MAELEHPATRLARVRKAPRADHHHRPLQMLEYAIAMRVPPRAETLGRHYAKMTRVTQRHDGSAYYFVDVLAVDVRIATHCALFCWGTKMCYLGRRP
jgi:hypothetical protein